MVGRQCIDCSRVNVEIDQTITDQIETDAVTRANGHGTKTRSDNAFVDRFLPQQGCIAAILNIDSALVQHLPAGAEELIIAGKKIVIADIQGGRHEASSVNTGCSREQNARLVNQEDLAASIDVTKDVGRVVADHPVERNVRGVLQEVHRVAG